MPTHYQNPSSQVSRLGRSAALRAWIETIDETSPTTTNQGSHEVPFQRWFKFKEAFSPLLVKRIIDESPIEVRKSLDVFGGCGTSALTSAFMGVHPTIIEVNPFLVDVIRAKLGRYDVNQVARNYTAWQLSARKLYRATMKLPGHLPPSFIECRGAERWIFSSNVMRMLEAYRLGLRHIKSTEIRRLFRVLLGSTLVDVSNVVVNGKGRRYRESWEISQKRPTDVVEALDKRIADVIYDVTRFMGRAEVEPAVISGDARRVLQEVEMADIVITSPPYPNSFDYTDIYNVELWVLGYVRTRAQETQLRHAAVRSHVQRQLPHSECCVLSETLCRTVKELKGARSELWSRQIPEMIESYFADLVSILTQLRVKVRLGGSISLIVADSAYGGNVVRVGKILAELADRLEFSHVSVEKLRDITGSAQQGWKRTLREEIVTFRVLS
jgi:hypothetical protein